MLNFFEKQKKLNLVSFDLSKSLGDGADGEVFDLKDKVVKISLIQDEDTDASFMKNIEKIKLANLPHFAKVFTFGKICSGVRTDWVGMKYSCYFYTMEKLNKISEDEKKVFHTLLSHEDSNKIKDLTKTNILDDLKSYLEFDKNKILVFINQIINHEIKHNDMHPRNIMKDSFGNFKFIDFDRVLCK
jgi:hypothetical protein